MITAFFRKSNSLIMIFKDKVSDFIDRHLFIALSIFEYTLSYIGKQKKYLENDLIDKKNRDSIK